MDVVIKTCTYHLRATKTVKNHFISTLKPKEEIDRGNTVVLRILCKYSKYKSLGQCTMYWPHKLGLHYRPRAFVFVCTET